MVKKFRFVILVGIMILGFMLTRLYHHNAIIRLSYAHQRLVQQRAAFEQEIKLLFVECSQLMCHEAIYKTALEQGMTFVSLKNTFESSVIERKFE